MARASQETSAAEKFAYGFKVKEFTGHTDEVNCVSFSPDFEILVTGSDDQSVRVYNVKTGRFVVKLKGHTGAIKSVAISEDSRLIASGSYDTTVRVWRTCDAELLCVLKGHSRSVECVAFSPQSDLICSTSWDKTAIVWDSETGRRRHTLTGHTTLVQCAAFSRCGRYLATGSWDCTVRVWPLGCCKTTPHSSKSSCGSSWTEVSDTSAVDSSVSSLDSRDSVSHLSENTTEPSETPDHHDCQKFEDVDVFESQEQCAKRGGSVSAAVFEGHTGNIHALVFSKHGILASGSWDRTIILWNPNWTPPLSPCDPISPGAPTSPLLARLTGHEGWIQAVCFSPGAFYVVSAADDDTVRVWMVESGECMAVMETQAECPAHVGFHPTGALVASGAAFPPILPPGDEWEPVTMGGSTKTSGKKQEDTIVHGASTHFTSKSTTGQACQRPRTAPTVAYNSQVKECSNAYSVDRPESMPSNDSFHQSTKERNQTEQKESTNSRRVSSRPKTAGKKHRRVCFA